MRALPCAGLVVLAAAACGDNQIAGGGPRVAFELPPPGQPVPLSALPFPSDLYLDSDGELDVPVEALPFGPDADPEVLAGVSAAFAELDCFGPGAGVVFPLAGLAPGDAVDPASLTADTALLVDLERGELLPVETVVRPLEQQVFLRARRGDVLRGGATYVAILTRGVALASGGALGAAPALEDLLAGEPGDHPAAAVAYRPLVDWLAGPDAALEAGDIAGAAVFTTCDVRRDMAAIVDQLDAAAAPALTVTHVWRAGAELDALLGTPGDDRAPGVDNPGGIAHADIGYLIAGTFPSPSFQTDTPGRLGAFERDGDGAPVVKGMEDVPVLIALPAGLDSYQDVPVVVFQHGLGESRAAVLAVANTLAAHGLATAGIDIPFHGARYPDAKDTRHNYGGGEGPDGLADPTGPLTAPLFFDLFGDEGVAPLDPRVQTASFLQAAIDAMVLARLLDGGDLTAVGAEVPALDGLGFRGDRIVYASESFGGFFGVIALAFEPRYQAGFLSVAGGGLLGHLLESSPTYAPFFQPVIGGAFGVAPNDVDPAYAPAHSHWAYQVMGLLLAGADPLSYARALPDKGVHLVIAAAFSDESVPNQSSEALAAAIGLPWLPLPGAVDGPRYLAPEQMPRAELPAVGNLQAGERRLTAGFTELDPATHGMITRQRGERKFEVGFPPFVGLPEPIEVANPIAELQGYLARFAARYASTGLPEVAVEEAAASHSRGRRNGTHPAPHRAQPGYYAPACRRPRHPDVLPGCRSALQSSNPSSTRRGPP